MNLGGDFEIMSPKSGSGAFICAYGYSEPETARFVMDYLKPGMTFWDVGAHLGEYSLLAARNVGETGRVHAFEPQPKIFEFLQSNLATNQVRNVTVHQFAVTDQTGVSELSIHADPAQTYLTPQGCSPGTLGAILAPATSLDDFYRSSGRAPNLIKVDVEGAERLVLRGAVSLLRLPAPSAPVWVIEYAPEHCSRFGYHPEELKATLATHGYDTFWLTDGGHLESSDLEPEWKYGINLVAAKHA